MGLIDGDVISVEGSQLLILLVYLLPIATGVCVLGWKEWGDGSFGTVARPVFNAHLLHPHQYHFQGSSDPRCVPMTTSYADMLTC